jgi:ABC-2 type transport system ATP-binding protein
MTASAADASAAIAALMAAGIELTDFAMGSPSLDEVFFALTGAPPAEAPGGGGAATPGEDTP